MKAILISSMLLFFFLQCKVDSNRQSTEGTNVVEIETRGDTSIPDEMVKIEPERSISAERIQARRALDRYFEQGSEPPSFLADRSFIVNYRLVVSQPMPGEELEGEWLSFGSDFTYEWYRDNVIFQKGVYFYSFDSEELLMLSDNQNDFPSEWQVKSAGDVMILVGTSTYKNNNTQMKMELEA